MGIFSRLFGIFKRKTEEAPEDLPEEIPLSALEINQETTTIENLKAKMDLITTHFDTLKTQYEVLNGKISSIEKMVKEMYEMSKS
ncbi:MAG: hypothetical protein HY361_02915 [Candidatus Aenigmarchaeota archaeon]|nr:hypothetical protein [Candidatus Aenigmarchaeota archaeon]